MLNSTALINTRTASYFRFNKRIFDLSKFFLIFLFFPAFDIFGLSITFYLFILLYLELAGKGIRVLKGKPLPNLLFGLFFLGTLISWIGEPSLLRSAHGFARFTVLLQYFYWVLVGLFFITNFHNIGFYTVSKWAFIGSIYLIISYYIKPFLPINISIGRNAVVYTMLCLTPFNAYYVVNRYGQRRLGLLLIVSILIMLSTNGRAGAILVLFESLLVYLVYNKRLYYVLMPLLIIGLLFYPTVSDYMEKDENRKSIASFFEPISPRFAALIAGEGEGDLEYDKSWLVRKLMIVKAFEIFKQYPVFGIGPLNFGKYDAQLPELYQPEFQRLYGHVKGPEEYNARSSHNSYVQILSELGLWGFICVVLILIIPVLKFIRRLITNKLTESDLPSLALFIICFHFYSITAFIGTITWFVLGSVYANLSNSSAK